MRYPWIDAYLLAKPGVTKDLKAEWNWLRYMIGGKLFAAVCLDWEDQPYYITLKLPPEEGEMMRAQYEDVIPGYYCNKQHWNSVRADGAVPDEVMKAMLDHAYRTVLMGLSGKKRQEALVTTYCGLDCARCDWRERCHCDGCVRTLGVPFHMKNGETCEVAACAQGRGVPFCGACADFPCKLLTDFSYDKEYGDDPPGARLDHCRWLAKLLKKA